jgi:DNA-binding MarR family transcriptional regulator
MTPPNVQCILNDMNDTSRAEDRFVDRMGEFAERDGLSRIAGRLFGRLLLSAAPRSLDDLAAELGVSKASVSTDARRLLDRGIAERTRRPGDRRDYYHLAPDFFGQLVRRRVERWEAIHDLVVDLRATMGVAPGAAPAPEVAARLAYLDDVHTLVVERVRQALDEWEADRG